MQRDSQHSAENSCNQDALKCTPLRANAQPGGPRGAARKNVRRPRRPFSMVGRPPFAVVCRHEERSAFFPAARRAAVVGCCRYFALRPSHFSLPPQAAALPPAPPAASRCRCGAGASPVVVTTKKNDGTRRHSSKPREGRPAHGMGEAVVATGEEGQRPAGTRGTPAKKKNGARKTGPYESPSQVTTSLCPAYPRFSHGRGKDPCVLPASMWWGYPWLVSLATAVVAARRNAGTDPEEPSPGRLGLAHLPFTYMRLNQPPTTGGRKAYGSNGRGCRVPNRFMGL
jgi:hypothetical protein